MFCFGLWSSTFPQFLCISIINILYYTVYSFTLHSVYPTQTHTTVSSLWRHFSPSRAFSYHYQTPFSAEFVGVIKRVVEGIRVELVRLDGPSANIMERIEDGYVFGFDEEAIIAEFEGLTRDAGRVQRDTLKKILEANGETEYLQQKCGLKGRTDPESFKACVPLVTYDDMETYIRRISDGEKSPILTGNTINTITLSSGTSQGKQKHVPFNDEIVANTMQIRKTSFAFRNREYPIGNGKALQFIYSSKQFITKGGLHAGTFSTHVFRHSTYKKLMHAMKTPYCSPDEVIFGDSFHQSLYCHWLCGLLFREQIQVIYSSFAHSILQALRSFENIWEDLANDIREGSLNSRITSKSIQSAMGKLLKPDPVLAKTIQDKCLGLQNWYGLIPEMFPNVKYVYGVMTGSMEPYVERLRHYAGGVPLLSTDYGSSEGWIGANVHPKLPPEMVTFAVLPNIGYFEFIPLDKDMDSSRMWAEPQPVGLTEVQAGKEYEIVITSFAGLYRYKLGDVVKVQGFHNSTPELQFVCRSNILLNINIDKTTERDLKLAVESSAKLLAAEKLEVIDYSSFVDVSTEPGHYVIYWEINGKASNEILEKCCNLLDKSFLDAGYMSSRKVNGISPLELRILKGGTFQEIMDHYVELGAAVSQYKTPRCIGCNNSKVVQILASNVTKNYFSTAYEKVIGASGA